MFPENYWITNQALELFTDSAGGHNLGCGAHFKNQWTYFKWPAKWKNSDIMQDITSLELIPVLLALYTWRHDLCNKKIIFHIDNSALTIILNKKTSKAKRVMGMVRKLVLITMENNIQFRAEHIPGIKNKAADALSRFQWEKFRLLVPRAEPIAEPIPEGFENMILQMK